MKKVIFSILLMIITLVNCALAQLTKRQHRNLTAFSKLYGYVRYFHPSDEAKIEYWNKFVIRGVQKMMTIEDDRHLVQGLNVFFKNIAPTAQIYEKGSDTKFDVNILTPKGKANLKTIAWQHNGLNLYATSQNIYHSIRINRRSPSIDEETYDLNLLENVDIESFRDSQFELSIYTKSSDAEKNDVINIDMIDKMHPGLKLDSISAFTLSKILKKLVFKSRFDSISSRFNLALQVEKKIHISIDSVILKVYDNSKGTTIPISSGSKMDTSSLTPQNVMLMVGLNDNTDKPLFTEHSRIGDYIDKELVSGIACIVPLALLGDQYNTYPIVDRKTLDLFEADISSVPNYRDNNAGDLKEVRLADIIMLWNVFKYSFPYWQDASTEVETMLNEGLLEASKEQTAKDFLYKIKRLCAPLNDGHIFIDFFDGSHRTDTLTLPIHLESTGNQIIVKDVLDTSLLKAISPGDFISQINGENALSILKRTESLISGSPQWKRFKALITVLDGPADRPITLSFTHNNKANVLDFQRTVPAAPYRAGNTVSYAAATGWIRPDIYYFDLTKDSCDPKYYVDLQKARVIIFDMRGYPVDDNVFSLPNHLLSAGKTITRFYRQKMWLPGLKNVQYVGEPEYHGPLKPHFDGKVIFLIDASAQSASESLLSLIKEFKLGVLVGSPTSGTNGNINQLYLPGNYRIVFTGMLVKNNDGSKHHLIGIEPDFKVERTRSSLRQKKDNILQYAIDLY